MKILYLSCWHPVMEYDHCNVFEDLGYDWFSMGVYKDPQHPINLPSINIRKPIDKIVNPKYLSLLERANPYYMKEFYGHNRPNLKVPKELVDNFDVVFSTSYKHIQDNWSVIKDKPVVWRTSGAINEKIAISMQKFLNQGNVHVVRFSPIENISPHCTNGHVIRNYADENIYSEWDGWDLENQNILTFQSWFSQRRTLQTNKMYMKHIYPSFKCDVYGAYIGNKDPYCKGTLDWQDQINEYKKCSVYFYLGAPIATIPYTYVEAMMVGCPLVTFGVGTGGWTIPSLNKKFYEPAEFIDNGVDGFCSDDPEELKDYIRMLLSDQDLSKKISSNARKKALQHFSKKKITAEWGEFLEKL